MNNILQILIVLTGVPAIWLVNRKEKWSKWGCVFGLTGQPIWLYLTYKNGQWGMFGLSMIYTYSWMQGIYFNFIKK